MELTIHVLLSCDGIHVLWGDLVKCGSGVRREVIRLVHSWSSSTIDVSHHIFSKPGHANTTHRGTRIGADLSEILGGAQADQAGQRYMTICISSYKTQWRSQEVEVEGWNTLSSSHCLGKWSNILGWIEGEAQNKGAKRPRFEVEARIESKAQDWAGEGSEVRARWAPPQKILKMHTWNRAILCIVQLFKRKFIFSQLRIEEFAENEHIPHFDPSQIQLYMSLRTL